MGWRACAIYGLQNEMKHKEVVFADLGLRRHFKLPLTFMGLSMPGSEEKVAGEHLSHQRVMLA